MAYKRNKTPNYWQLHNTNPIKRKRMVSRILKSQVLRREEFLLSEMQLQLGLQNKNCTIRLRITFT